MTFGVSGIAPADAGDKCADATLDGFYVFTASGFSIVSGVPQPIAIVEQIRFNGDGTADVPGGRVSVNGSVFPTLGPGTYTIGSLTPVASGSWPVSENGRLCRGDGNSGWAGGPCLRSPSRATREVRIFSARCLGVYVWGAANLGPAAVGETPKAAPHPPQNFTPGSFENPQDGQARAKGEPHSAQNRRPALLALPQRGQVIASPHLPDGSHPRNRGAAGCARISWSRASRPCAPAEQG